MPGSSSCPLYALLFPSLAAKPFCVPLCSWLYPTINQRSVLANIGR